MTRPLLIMTGSEDRVLPLLDPDPAHDGPWRASLFSHLPAGDKALAFLTDARHSTFSGGAGAILMGEPPADPRHLVLIQDTTLAWWDAHLRNTEAAQQAQSWLRKHLVAIYGEGMVRWQER